jgi:GST-like protein
MIDVYSANTPNGVKVTIALEEMGEPYDLHVLSLSEKDQKQPNFLKINPNGRIPAIIDNDGPDGKTLRVFESGAILLYLAEKYGKLLPSNPQDRIDAIAWAFFQTGGIGPIMGQAGFFKKNFPEFADGFDRFNSESHRLVSVMDGVLKHKKYLAGGDISIADIMNYGWLDRAPNYFGFDVSPYPAVLAWLDRMSSRDGVKKGMAAFSGS